MTTKKVDDKWQHFVPQFYFRFFSSDGILIQGYSLKSRKFFSGPISRQAAKDYFYSEDTKIEKLFFPWEGKFAIVLNKIIKDRGFSSLTPQDHMEMLRFISFQKDRTQYSKNLTKELIDKIYENYLKPMIKSNKELMKRIGSKEIDEAKLNFPNTFLLKAICSLESNVLLRDLIPVLLVNKTEGDYIFSDNPVIFYNLIYNKDPTHSFQAIYSPGLLVFCPISPKHCILLYDPEYYKVDSKVKNVLDLTSIKDVRNINTLQFHNSLGTIYYGDSKNKSIINAISKDFFIKYKKGEELSNLKEVKNWDGSGNGLLVTSSKAIPEIFEFGFLKCAKFKREVLAVRNQRLYELYKEKMKLYGFTEST